MFQIDRQGSEFSTDKSVTFNGYPGSVPPLLEARFQWSRHSILHDRCQRQFLFLNPFTLQLHTKWVFFI